MSFQKVALAAVAAVAMGALSTQASAFTSTDTLGQTATSFAGVTQVSFDSLAVNSAVSGFGSGVATFDKGAIYNSTQDGVTAVPTGYSGSFWSVGTSPEAQTGPGTVTFSTGVKYVGFLWGSSDAYNSIVYTVLNTVTHLTSTITFTGLDAPTGNGDQSVSSYFEVFADANEEILGVSLTSTKNAFETANWSYSVTAVPEADTYAMMLAGLGLMGAIARRRNKSKNA